MPAVPFVGLACVSTDGEAFWIVTGSLEQPLLAPSLLESPEYTASQCQVPALLGVGPPVVGP